MATHRLVLYGIAADRDNTTILPAVCSIPDICLSLAGLDSAPCTLARPWAAILPPDDLMPKSNREVKFDDVSRMLAVWLLEETRTLDSFVPFLDHEI